MNPPRLRPPLRTAATDPLTGLPNRRGFGAAVRRIVAAAGDGHVGVLIVDLDGFRQINDTFGEDAGDGVLVAVARCLTRIAGAHATVGRLGGDEFGIVVGGACDVPDPAAAILPQIIDAMAAPCHAPSGAASTGASIGIAQCPASEASLDALLRDARLALAEAKADDSTIFRICDAEMQARAGERARLRLDVVSALDRGQLELYYQPIVRLVDGSIAAVEGLVRWNHPVRGVLSPGEFLDDLEASGQAAALTSWSLHEACARAQLWRTTIPSAAALEVAVNISARQLENGELRATVLAALQASGLPAAALTIEVTECAAWQRARCNTLVLRSIAATGVKIAIDDFGTGHSSLARLRDLPPMAAIKIDRTFVSELDTGARAGAGPSRDRAIVGAVVTLGHNLAVDVIAEGIEHDSQRRALLSLGCRLGQGYLFGRPRSASVTAALLAGASAAPPGQPATTASASGRNVLVVDDDAGARSILRQVLEGAGHSVETAVDGEAALLAMNRREFDLVLMDLLMPRADGCEATALIRDDPALRGTPVVAVSSLAPEEYCLRAGPLFDGAITKPIDPRRLASDLDPWLAAVS